MKFNTVKAGIAAMALLGAVSCTEIAFGDKFLGDAPESSGSTLETMFSSQYYADQVLTRAYQGLPYGLTYRNSSGTNVFRFGVNPLECISDLCQGMFSGNQNASAQSDYYTGALSAGTVSSIDAYLFGSSDWTTVKYALIYLENVDKVPDMSEAEKLGRKAEAKVVLAVAYFNMLRNVGGIPWITHSIGTDDSMHFPRETFAKSVDNIVKLLDEAVAEPNLEWKWDDNNDGRMSRAGAMALKFKVLQFAASPMFNSDVKWHPQADEYTCYGNYDAARWQAAADAGKAFFNEVNRRGEYALIRATADNPAAYRAAYRRAYYNRGGSETLISIRKGGYGSDVYGADSEASIYTTRLSIGPTLNYVDMFAWANGDEFPENFNWENPNRQPFFDDDGQTLTRDPRLYENVAVPGDVYFNGNSVPTYFGHPSKQQSTTGFLVMKFMLQTANDRRNVLVHWPHTRMAEIMLGYAEVLNEVNGGPDREAYDMVNNVRARVGLNKLPDGMSQEQFREAVLRERACELGFEEVRWFDLIRWNRVEDFRKTLYGLEITMKKGEASDNAKNFTYKKVALPNQRAWATNWDSKWFLSPIPQTEINKKYGMTQNPGW
ncbi:MAG: RagB/SusD family nutrient uptake outer membrane protein [Alistipes sp.]|nr:RagB/SusD family nutrient uptake outer membrane protein [Alistipes sp.]